MATNAKEIEVFIWPVGTSPMRSVVFVECTSSRRDYFAEIDLAETILQSLEFSDATDEEIAFIASDLERIANQIREKFKPQGE